MRLPTQPTLVGIALNCHGGDEDTEWHDLLGPIPPVDEDEDGD
jgi:hypothetical protein